MKSFDRHDDDDDNSNKLCLINIVRDDAPLFNAFNDDLNVSLNKELASIPERERLSLELFYGLNDCEKQTYRKIAERLGISLQRVDQICKQAKHKLSQSWQLRNIYYRCA